jgi:hypothetical protein
MKSISPCNEAPGEIRGFLFKTFLIIKKLVTLITRDDNKKNLISSFFGLCMYSFITYLKELAARLNFKQIIYENKIIKRRENYY